MLFSELLLFKIEDAVNEDLFELFLRNFITQISQKVMTRDQRCLQLCHDQALK